MPVVTLPDGSQRRFDHPVTVDEVAAAIGPGLRKAALAGRVNGKLVDTSHVIADDAAFAVVTDRDPEGLDIIRHSTAHLLAQAVKELFPDAQVTIGPVIEDGFYYDFAYQRPFTPEDLAAIEAKMAELARADQKVTRRVMARDEAVQYFKRRASSRPSSSPRWRGLTGVAIRATRCCSGSTAPPGLTSSSSRST